MAFSRTKTMKPRLPAKLAAGALYGLMAMLVLLFLAQAAIASGFEFVQTTGRAVIMHKDAEQEARLVALEDALYTAALHGGAEIDGFSLITTDTAIDDHFVVRPASRILDYRIVNEVVEDEHYAVTIEAAVGDLPESKCQARGHSNVTIYAPVVKMAATAPAWSRQFADVMLRDVVLLLDRSPSLNVRNATRTRLDPAALARSNDNFDYAALTTGRVRVKQGDFAIIPEIHLDGQRQGNLVLSSRTMNVKVKLRLLSGTEYEPLLEHEMNDVIKIEQSSLIRSMDVLTNPTRPAVLAAMRAGLGDFINDFTLRLQCRPLRAEVEFAQNKLTVPLGIHHGVGVNSLAIASGTDTPWQILRVSAADQMTATLTPLNNQRDQSSLAGATIEFMELR